MCVSVYVFVFLENLIFTLFFKWGRLVTVIMLHSTLKFMVVILGSSLSVNCVVVKFRAAIQSVKVLINIISRCAWKSVLLLLHCGNGQAILLEASHEVLLWEKRKSYSRCGWVLVCTCTAVCSSKKLTWPSVWHPRADQGFCVPHTSKRFMISLPWLVTQRLAPTSDALNDICFT